MSRPVLPRLRSSHSFKKASVVAAVAAAAAAGLGVAPAQSAPSSDCPAAYPVADLTQGQAVHGYTVSKGNELEEFTGTIDGVLTNTIGAGRDLIMADLDSPTIDQVGGIWEGMSGSPVYAEDGSLIGAVSYGLATGPSKVAGITPAADMEKLLVDKSSIGAAPQPAGPVAVPSKVQRRVVSSGAASASEADSGMTRLKTPFALAGVGQDRVAQLRKLFRNDGFVKQGYRMVTTGTSTSSSDTTGAPAADKIFPGSNLAAAMSYGDVTSAGIGTTTAVCGKEVLAFGHPMNYTGTSTMTLHSASAVRIQDDPTLVPFKLANIDEAPLGTITQDRMAGLDGTLEPPAQTPDVTSTVNFGGQSYTGVTHVSVPEVMPDIATTQLVNDQDTLFDGIGKGSGTVGWTINGQREDGTPFTLTRSDKFADRDDIVFAPAFDLYDMLSRIQYNGTEDVTINSVTTTSDLSTEYKHYEISGVKVRTHGVWAPLNTNKALRIPAGSTKALQVTLTSKQLRTKTVVLHVDMPRRALGKFGYLDVFGGNSGPMGGASSFLSSGFSTGQAQAPTQARTTTSPSAFDRLLQRLGNKRHNDDVVAHLYLFGNNGNLTNQRRVLHSTGTVVDGGLEVEVRGTF
jgi:hypothetical protein